MQARWVVTGDSENSVKRSLAESAAWVLLGAVLAGNAGHWFITPIRHAGAPSWKYAAIGIQLVVGIALGLYGAGVQRREQREDREDAHLDHTA